MMSSHDFISAQNLYIWGFLLQGAQSTALSHPKNPNGKPALVGNAWRPYEAKRLLAN